MEMSRLDEILQVKRGEIEQLRPRAAELHRKALERTDFRSFRSALKRVDGKLALIAEVKKASPSAGLIAESFHPVEVATSYEQAGAEAISVLTDEQFFQGKLEYLSRIREVVRVPLLRKDFILDEIQVTESVVAGADAILLIVAAVESTQLTVLSAAAAKHELDVLVEVHTLEELDRALDAGAEIIGINNRNLATFEVDISVTERLSEEVPDGIVLVSESGIKSLNDATQIDGWGVDAILVGEALMRGEISIEALRG